VSSKLNEIALKKQRLEMRSETLRTQIAADALALEPAFAQVDRLMAAIAWLRQRPLLVVAALAALILARPRGLLRWAKRALPLILAVRRLRRAGGDKLIGKLTGRR